MILRGRLEVEVGSLRVESGRYFLEWFGVSSKPHSGIVRLSLFGWLPRSLDYCPSLSLNGIRDLLVWRSIIGGLGDAYMATEMDRAMIPEGEAAFASCILGHRDADEKQMDCGERTGRQTFFSSIDEM